MRNQLHMRKKLQEEYHFSQFFEVLGKTSRLLGYLYVFFSMIGERRMLLDHRLSDSQYYTSINMRQTHYPTDKTLGQSAPVSWTLPVRRLLIL